jgi:Zn-finger nucleic acid-binding protein
MEERQEGGITLDRCNLCSGTWFDRGELETYRYALESRGKLDDVATGTFQRIYSHRAIACPRCLDKPLDLGKVVGHEVARCSGCHGVWIPGSFLRKAGSSALEMVVGAPLEAAFQGLIELAVRAIIGWL